MTFLNIYLRTDLKETKRETHVFVNIDYLRGYTSESLAAYHEIADEMRKLLPGMESELTDDRIRCGKVVKSTYCDRCSVVTWDGMISKKKVNEFEKLGWRISDRQRDYQLA